jgi:hypothetical protein
MSNLRLGDIIDDYCAKCRRLTNHAIVSIVNEEVAKVRCRSCYHDHTYLHEQIPPSKKDLKKLELANAALAAGQTAPGLDGDHDPLIDDVGLLAANPALIGEDGDLLTDDIELLAEEEDEEIVPEPEAEPKEEEVPAPVAKPAAKKTRGKVKKA